MELMNQTNLLDLINKFKLLQDDNEENYVTYFPLHFSKSIDSPSVVIGDPTMLASSS